MSENVMVQKKGAPKSMGSTRNDMLKITAMLTMLIDHIGYIFFPGVMIFRTIGRIAFPIFAYQISVGFKKTSDLKEYFKRLFIFGLISQIPYMFLNPSLQFNGSNSKVNVILLFCIGIGMLYLYKQGVESIKDYKNSKSAGKLLKGIGLLISTLIIMVFPQIFEVITGGLSISYGSYGLVMIFMFYLIGDKVLPVVLSYLVLSFVFPVIEGAIFTAQNSKRFFYQNYTIFQCLFQEFDKVWQVIGEHENNFKRLSGFFFQSRSIIALIPIYLFTSLPSKIKLNKYVSYAFYPAHITILVLIAYLMRNVF